MADIKNKQLQNAIATLGKAVTKDADLIDAAAQKIREEAQDCFRLAEQIAGLGVDPETVAECRELGNTMDHVEAAARVYAIAANATARQAIAAIDQAKASHDGIQEAVNRSPVDVSSLNRSWLTPE